MMNSDFVVVWRVTEGCNLSCPAMKRLQAMLLIQGSDYL